MKYRHCGIDDVIREQHYGVGIEEKIDETIKMARSALDLAHIPEETREYVADHFNDLYARILPHARQYAPSHLSMDEGDDCLYNGLVGVSIRRRLGENPHSLWVNRIQGWAKDWKSGIVYAAEGFDDIQLICKVDRKSLDGAIHYGDLFVDEYILNAEPLIPDFASDGFIVENIYSVVWRTPLYIDYEGLFTERPEFYDIKHERINEATTTKG